MLFNDSATFREDMLKGYTLAYPDYVVEVPGGVARATEMPAGKVAVINGGGSGHYPAFCGIVGDGFMDATVVGNVFTSPSTEDVLNVAHSVNNNTGIFIVGGNYAGDKMNFNMARDELIKEGIDARTFYITDDVASAKPEEWEKRRGNVGTFTVFKSVGAAAAEGLSLDELERVANKSNNRTRTFSLGMRGPILPGATEPLFHVPEGKMEVGQGIHGEPGVGESDLKPAAEIAELLVEKVLAEAPADDSKRIAVILDGLGSTKYEELFVVWSTVRPLLESKGYTLVAPLVGEFVTSLDMQGIALSVEFLDDELEKYWLAPCDTASFRRGGNSMQKGHRKVYADVTSHEDKFAAGSEASNAAADYIVAALGRMKQKLIDEEAHLAKIDGVAGDGDHGRGMVKGSTFAYEAAVEARKHGAAAGSVLEECVRRKQYLFHFPENEIISLHAKILRLMDEKQENRYGCEAFEELCIRDLLMTMCRMIHEKNTPKGKSQQLKLLDITQYIDHHLEEDLSLDDLAGIFYVSKYYIAHRFRERLGISVHQYILKKRLEQCAASIARGSSITRTFTEYGFRDYASFYRAFRKEYGISPKEYQEASA